MRDIRSVKSASSANIFNVFYERISYAKKYQGLRYSPQGSLLSNTISYLK